MTRGNTLYVGGSGPGNYSKIQDAIDNASKGDTVYVYHDSSPYREFIIIQTTINLIGENKYTTVIEGFNNIRQHLIQINADGVRLHGFTVKNSTYGPVPEGCYAIAISSNDNDISGNILTKNADDILINHTSRNKIHDNVISNGPLYCTAVRVAYGDQNEIFNNTISSVSMGIEIDDMQYAPFTGSVSNKVHGNSMTHIEWMGISVNGARSQDNRVYQNHVSDAMNGIDLSECRFCFVYGNEITNCSHYGIYRSSTQCTFIMRNNLKNNSCNAYFYNTGVLNIWRGNYWDDWGGSGFYTIHGKADGLDPDVPVNAKQFDRHPAREPYVI